MIINQIELENFTSYEGEYYFEFANEKRFNLINGENGNGKTSLLKAIIFGLYGAKMFDSTHLTKQYKDFIFNTLNNNTKANYFRVKLNFKYQNTQYQIERKIILNSARTEFEEHESITANGSQVAECSLLNEYTKDVIELFFFNGETILEIIKNNNFNTYINQLIEISFNLNTFKQLSKDVQQSIANNYKDNASSKYKSLIKTLSTKEKLLFQAQEQASKLAKKLEQDRLNQETIKKEMKTHGVLRDEQVNQLLKQDSKLKEAINHDNELLTAYFADGTINKILLNRLNKQHYEKLKASRKERLNQLQELYNNIENEKFIPNPGISYELERDIILRTHDDSVKICTNILDLTKEITQNEKKLIKIRTQIAQSETGQEYINYGDNLNFYEQEIITSMLDLSDSEALIDKLDQEIEQLRSEIDEEKKQILKTSLQANAINEKAKLTKIIAEYQQTKLADIYQELNLELNYVVKQVLLRKANLVDKIIFVDQRLRIYQGKQEVNFTSFSAGEQQMLIVGVILSVLKVSKNMNPLVLDTFIGRLDGKHTKNILKFLQNEIPNQVIILSTDREITKKEFAMIKDDINSSYQLSNDGYKSILRKGYFNYEN